MRITFKLLLPHLQGLSGENKTNLVLVCLQGDDILTFFKDYFLSSLYAVDFIGEGLGTENI
jgi:hypothetical protein